jgi:hypothetical protein
MVQMAPRVAQLMEVTMAAITIILVMITMEVTAAIVVAAVAAAPVVRPPVAVGAVAQIEANTIPGSLKKLLRRNYTVKDPIVGFVYPLVVYTAVGYFDERDIPVIQLGVACKWIFGRCYQDIIVVSIRRFYST